MLLERGRVHRDVAGHSLVLEGADQAHGSHHFSVHAVERILGAVRSAGDVPPNAARSDVHLVDRDRIPSRPPPERDELRIRVRVEHAGSGSVEDTFHDDLSIGRKAQGVGFLSLRRGLFPLRRSLQALGQFIERFAPPRLGSVALLACRKAGVRQGEFRLSTQFLERHRHEHLQWDVGTHAVVCRRDHVAFLVGEAICGDDPRRRDDLAIDVLAPVVLPFGRSHAVQEYAAHAQVDRAERRREPFRPPPALHVLWVRPRLPEALARRVELARDDESPCIHGAFSSRGILGRHGHSSQVATGSRSSFTVGVAALMIFPPSVWPIGRSGLPRGRGTG